MSVLTHRMPCKNRHEKNVPKHKKGSGTFSFIVREILIYLAPSQLFSSFVTAHNRKLIRSSAQDGRKMVAKPKKMGHRFYRYPIDFIVVRPAGIEPAAYCLGGNRSIRLSYERASYLVKQSDARCQVEAGGRKVLHFRG